MADFSPENAVAMEVHHIVEGGRRIARQEKLLREVTERGQDEAARSAGVLLALLRETPEFPKVRLLELQRHQAMPITVTDIDG